MAKFLVTYRETYERQYCVEAENQAEAESKVQEAIMDGDVDGPDVCVDSDGKAEKTVDDMPVDIK
jgi:hypothetical protein